MRRLEIRLNGHLYALACDDGEEDHVLQLADEVDSRAREIAARMPKAGEGLVLVMTALMLADELYDARQEAGTLHEKLSRLRAQMQSGNSQAAFSFAEGEAGEALARTMHDMAGHIDRVAASLEEA